MNLPLTPAEALAAIPQLRGRKCDWTALSGGLTNRNFKVRTADAEYVLRLDHPYTATLRFDRGAEALAREVASSAGIGPRLLFSDRERGIALSEFLPGKVWDERQLAAPENLARVAALLRQLHTLPALGVPLNAVETAVHYAGNLREKTVSAVAERCIAVVEASSRSGDVCFCHNDVIAANIVDGGTLKLLDWEYAADNDPLFDLACLIGYHDLDDRQARLLLDVYAGGVDPALRERLRIQRQRFDALQWLWFASYSAANPRRGFSGRLRELQRRLFGRHV